MDFEHWFYEKGSGNGGSFPRSEYVQIFEDLALSMGNPNGSNADPALLHVALGPEARRPWIKGDPSLGLPPGTDCSFTVDPIGDDPGEARQQGDRAKCKAWRCDPKNSYKAETNYFDDEYNPDGTLPVISFCDGDQGGGACKEQKDCTDPVLPVVRRRPCNAPPPYRNTWAPGGDKPVNLGLAVDLNKNGIRDQGEPVIRAGHEPYDDCGPDKLCDVNEPGYNAETNPDPNQDDYDYLLNPSGHRGQPPVRRGRALPRLRSRRRGRTPPADTWRATWARADGKYTEAIGLTNFYANDAHNIVSQRVNDAPRRRARRTRRYKRIDVLTDGGVRDLFNFASVANHFTGQLFGRRGPDGLPLRSVAFYNGFHNLPGEPSDMPRSSARSTFAGPTSPTCRACATATSTRRTR